VKGKDGQALAVAIFGEPDLPSIGEM